MFEILMLTAFLAIPLSHMIKPASGPHPRRRLPAGGRQGPEQGTPRHDNRKAHPRNHRNEACMSRTLTRHSTVTRCNMAFQPDNK